MSGLGTYRGPAMRLLPEEANRKAGTFAPEAGAGFRPPRYPVYCVLCSVCRYRCTTSFCELAKPSLENFTRYTPLLR